MNLPLSDIRILDLTWVVSGPQASRLLADYGAEILKIERPTVGDPVRANHGMFVYFNRNKKAIQIDLNDPEGLNTFKELLLVSDVVMENFSAGIMRRWGLDYPGLAEINPSIIYLSMPGFGHDGPYKNYQSNGPTIQAISGQTFICGDPKLDPAGWGYSYMDHTAGYLGASAILQALYHRNNTGEGQFIDLAQYEAATSLMGTYLLDYEINGKELGTTLERTANKGVNPAAAPQGVYEGKTPDTWIAFSITTDQHWKSLINILDQPKWANDKRFSTFDVRLQNIDDLDKEISTCIKSLDVSQLAANLQKENIPASQVQDTFSRAEKDIHLRKRDHITEVEDEDGRMVRVDSLPFKMKSIPEPEYTYAPKHGQDNSYVFKEILGKLLYE
jgi:crotonobetainyl-CoA:carnitine CoA-transferase CaiB-like acyl-CoA transferase